MTAACALATAGLLDWLIGDPCWLPHPVRLLGLLIDTLEKTARKQLLQPVALKTAGALITLALGFFCVLCTVAVVKLAFRLHPVAGFAAQTYFYYVFIAGGDLRHHVKRVEKALLAEDITLARRATGMLVSRDTENLKPGELSRATLESLFESLSDGLIAPLFYGALFGPAAMAFYKTVNTLDSMIGYKTSPYLHLGWFAARLDDFLNFIPARLSAVLIIVAGFAGGNFFNAVKTLKENRFKHESPNSAWPEAAAAGVLGVRFGGADYYRGRLVFNEVINPAGRPVTAGLLGPGLSLYYRVTLFAYLVFVPLAWGARALEVSLY